MDDSVRKITDLLEADIDDLYLSLANQDGMVRFGASEGNEETGKALGKAIFKDYIMELRPKICSRKEIQKYLSSNNDGSTEVIVAVLDLVLSYMEQIPVFVVTALILKFGIRKICSGEVPS